MRDQGDDHLARSYKRSVSEAGVDRKAYPSALDNTRRERIRLPLTC